MPETDRLPVASGCAAAAPKAPQGGQCLLSEKYRRRAAIAALMLVVAVAAGLLPAAWIAQARGVVASPLEAATAVAAAGLWLLPGPVKRDVAAWWVVSEPPGPADIALVLGGLTPWRPRAAAELYRRGLVRRVLVAQTKPADAKRDWAVLLAAGVPAAAIAPFGDGVASTNDEAVAAAAWAAAHGITRIAIPTNASHTRRVNWIFSERAPAGVTIAVLALRELGVAPTQSPGDWLRIKDFAREALKYAYYRLRYRRIDPPAMVAAVANSSGRS